MSRAFAALEEAISEVARLDKVLKKGRPRVQVTLSDERQLTKATCLTWFNNHKPLLLEMVSEDDITALDDMFRELLRASEGSGSRDRYIARLKAIKKGLIELRASALILPPARAPSTDGPPDFGPLIADPVMQQIIRDRWDECARCLTAGVPLAATVMMGGLLEGILLARVNREADKRPIFTARSAPRDNATRTKPLSDWMLKDYIQVAHEVSWITVSARDVGAVLRDYRNYIHPQKQFSHGITLKHEDAEMFWEISKAMCKQIIASVR